MQAAGQDRRALSKVRLAYRRRLRELTSLLEGREPLFTEVARARLLAQPADKDLLDHLVDHLNASEERPGPQIVEASIVTA